MSSIDRARVLVVDGDPSSPSLLRARLRTSGYEVHRAADGGTALALARGVRPGVVVFDDDAVGGGALELCRAIHRDPLVRTAWTVVLAGGLDTAGTIDLLDAGADDVLPSPFSMDELLARVRVGVRSRALVHEQSQSRHERALLALAATLGHEVNNPLTALVGHLELAREGLAKGDAGRVSHHLRGAGESADRIAAVARRLAALREARTTTYLDEVPMLDLAGS